MTGGPIRVALVDDHAVVRLGIATMLSVTDDLLLVGEATDGPQALALVRRERPDVLLLDLILPSVSGVELIGGVLAASPTTRVLVLTSYEDPALVQAAMLAGASGYLLKNLPAPELAAAIRGAHAGRPVLSPEAAQALISTLRKGETPIPDLTDREREVLALLALGHSNGAIAAHLSVSLFTVKNHVSHILTKLGVGSRTEAVVRALQLGLVAGPSANRSPGSV